MRETLGPRAALQAVVIGAAILVGGCGGGGDGDTGAKTTGGRCERVSNPPVKHQSFDRPTPTLRRGEAASVEVKTSCGAFTIDLATDRAPKTANSFAFLAERRFFDRTVFHRIAPDFVIQGGDPGGAGPKAGIGGPGYTVTEAPPADAAYTRGVVAMAKGGNDPRGESGSQFFVVTAGDANLPPDYALLGRVRSGMAVVDAISRLGGAGPSAEEPSRPVVVQSIRLKKRGG